MYFILVIETVLDCVGIDAGTRRGSYWKKGGSAPKKGGSGPHGPPPICALAGSSLKITCEHVLVMYAGHGVLVLYLSYIMITYGYYKRF